MSAGLFITLEGGEGAGKSTLLQALGDILAQRGYAVVVTREPGGSLLGEQIRQWLLQPSPKIDDRAELLLFLAARAQHIDEVIRPALEARKIVLCDRFNDSTIAYQGGARKLGIEEVHHLCQWACGGIKPDVTLFLDVDPMIGLLRTKKLSKEHALSGQLDRIEAEALEFHQHVRETFQWLQKQEPKRIYTIDASLSQTIVLQKACEVIDSRLAAVQTNPPIIPLSSI